VSTALDTNVIVYVISGTADTAARAARALEKAARTSTSLVLCAPVYAELLALPKWTKSDLDAFLSETKIQVDWDMPAEIWTNAGLAFAAYARRRTRQRSGHPRRILADFIIGAHAARTGGLLTADAAFYRTNFPDTPILEM
jgi:predicted nucleic acid-binding protein